MYGTGCTTLRQRKIGEPLRAERQLWVEKVIIKLLEVVEASKGEEGVVSEDEAPRKEVKTIQIIISNAERQITGVRSVLRRTVCARGVEAPDTLKIRVTARSMGQQEEEKQWF